MKLITTNYNLWIENNNYYLFNNGIVNEIIYSVYLIENKIETVIIENASLLDTETGTIALTTEGVYKLKITAGLELYYYDLRYFPTLKNNIIRTIRDTFCNCSTEEGCTSIQPIITEVYKLQLLFSSTNLFRDLLLSTSFIRNYHYAFTIGLDDKNTNLLTLIQDSYNTLDITGELTQSTLSINLYIAYIYILFYVIEMDTLLYETDVDRINVGVLFNDNDTTEVRALKTIYNFENLISCYEALDIDLIEIHNLIFDAYIQYPLGLMDMSVWETLSVGQLPELIDGLPKAGLYTNIDEANKPYGIAVFHSKYFKASGGAITLSDELIAFLEAAPIDLTAANVSYDDETYNNVQDALDALFEVSSDKNYVHTQGSVSASWNVAHNLNKYPSVTVLTAQGIEVEGEVVHTDVNNTILNFSAPFSGVAIFN